MKKLVFITVWPTHFRIRVATNVLKDVLESVSEKLTSYSYVFNKRFKRLVRQKDKGYYIKKSNYEFIFSINVLSDVILTLGRLRITREDIQLEYAPKHPVAEVEFGWNEEYQLRDYQREYVDRLLSKDYGNTTLVDLYTGGGKSIIFVRYLYEIKKRCAMLILPKFIDKWIEDISNYTDCKPEDICVVQGSKDLKALSLMDVNDIKWKFIIFSLSTITIYMNTYEAGELDQDILPPDQLMQKLQVGILFNDESHLNFHALYKAVLYFDVERLIGMTATLTDNNKAMVRIYNTLFPEKFRIANIKKLDNYVNVKQISYNLENAKHVQYKSNKGYSQALFEQYIMRHSMFLRNYTDMILHYFKTMYLDRRQEGDKCLLYFGTIRMCHIFANTLQDLYPNLTIGTYVEDDDYDKIITNEVSCSTLGSASTGLNIQGLLTVISTVSVSSVKSNLQSLGRLRRRDGKDLWYLYFCCRDIPPQMKHAQDRKLGIEHTVDKYEFEYYKVPVRVR